MSRLDALTLRQLRALRAVVSAGTLTGAAHALRLSPPAVHGQIRALEELMAGPLLQKGEQGGFIPTPEGQALLDAETQIAVALENCAQRIAALQKGKSGSVVLGAVSTGKYFAPGLVAKLRTAFPDIEVTLRIGNREAIVAALTAGSLDLAIMGRPPRQPPVQAELLGAHPHIIIAAPDHPLAQSDPAMPDELLTETFLAREEGSGTRMLLGRILDRIGEGQPFRLIEMGSNETIKQAVMAGLGIALISQHTVTEELRTNRLVAVKTMGLPIQRSWYLLRQAETQITPAVQRLHDYIVDLRGSFLPN